VHLFGSYGEPPSVANLPQFTKTIPTTWTAGTAGAPEPQLWLIQGYGHSRQRSDAGVILTPLERGAAQQDEGSWCARPMAKLSVKLGGKWSRRPIAIDGDSSLLVYAKEVTVSALVPAAVQDVGAPETALEVPLRAVAVDDIIGCDIFAVPTSDGGASTTFSQYFVAGDAVITTLRVPHGAVSVLIEPEAAGAPGTWTWTIGDRSVIAPIRLGSFTPDNTPVLTPGASHLEVAAAAGPRGFLITWTVR